MSGAQRKPGGLVETIKTVVYALLIAFAVRTIAFEPFNIPSGSMIPTLLVGDYLFVSKFSYGYSHFSLPFAPNLFSGRIFGSEPQRGDVIVFADPGNISEMYIKRLIGLPGDKIQVIDGVLNINGTPVKRTPVTDSYAWVDQSSDGGRMTVSHSKEYLEELPGGVKHMILQDDNFPPADNTQVYTVPAGHYFMMGDNRDHSEDSRFMSDVGYVPAENLVGKAEFFFFSTDGTAGLLEPWKWPFATRWSRFFNPIH